MSAFRRHGNCVGTSTGRFLGGKRRIFPLDQWHPDTTNIAPLSLRGADVYSFKLHVRAPCSPIRSGLVNEHGTQTQHLRSRIPHVVSRHGESIHVRRAVTALIEVPYNFRMQSIRTSEISAYIAMLSALESHHFSEADMC